MNNNESILKKSENKYVKVSDIGAIILELEKSDLKFMDYNKAIEKICNILDNAYIIIPKEEEGKINERQILNGRHRPNDFCNKGKKRTSENG